MSKLICGEKYKNFTPPVFDWPEFNDDKERIKKLTKRFKDLSIAEAFAKVYGWNVDQLSENYLESEKTNTCPVNIGDIIKVTVETVSKKDSLVSYHNSKDQFVLKQNISTWSIRPGDELIVSVVEKRKDGYVVDCIEPLYNDWIKKVSKTFKNVFQSYQVKVSDLEVQSGGYTGKIEIPEISKFIGKPYTIDAFIPGSQIVLNKENDFGKWSGKTVDAMITNFTQINNPTLKKSVFSAACSRKKYLNTLGGTSMVNIFDAGYGHDKDGSGRLTQLTFEGNVTGILNSAKKHGVFVEIPEYSITGMIEKDPVELVNYHINDKLNVQINYFDWDPRKQPYRRDKDGILTEVNLKPIFVEV